MESLRIQGRKPGSEVDKMQGDHGSRDLESNGNWHHNTSRKEMCVLGMQRVPPKKGCHYDQFCTCEARFKGLVEKVQTRETHFIYF